MDFSAFNIVIFCFAVYLGAVIVATFLKQFKKKKPEVAVKTAEPGEMKTSDAIRALEFILSHYGDIPLVAEQSKFQIYKRCEKGTIKVVKGTRGEVVVGISSDYIFGASIVPVEKITINP